MKSSSMSESESPTEMQEVETLPYPVANGTRFRLMTNRASPKYTHYLFQFPSKFHAPVIKWMLKHFVPEDGVVLDPYNGSGTIQVEALVGGRNSIGIDIDLVATYIAEAKTTPIVPKNLREALRLILDEVESLRRPDGEYEQRMFEDLSDDEFDKTRRGLAIPNIPNIEHWFRRYVIIDLAHLLEAIEEVDISSDTRRFFLALFAAIIRRCSNADPVPVSGLEYTKVMRHRDKGGRYIDPFALFEQRAEREIAGMEELWGALEHPPKNWAIVHHGDVLDLTEELERIRNRHNVQAPIDAVITSPPYCSAVDYHTRHKLEAHWLRQVQDQDEYLEWYHYYIGRRRILVADRDGCKPFGIEELDDLINMLRDEGREDRAAAMHDYFASLESSFEQISQVLRPRGTFVIFIGNSTTKGHQIDTHSFAKEMASHYFDFDKEFSYEIRNHYMRYSRHNEARIDVEWVMVFNKRR